MLEGVGTVTELFGEIVPENGACVREVHQAPVGRTEVVVDFDVIAQGGVIVDIVVQFVFHHLGIALGHKRTPGTEVAEIGVLHVMEHFMDHQAAVFDFGWKVVGAVGVVSNPVAVG